MNKVYAIIIFLLSIYSSAEAQTLKDSLATLKVEVLKLDVSPQYPGGKNKFLNFVYSNYKIPDAVLTTGVSGRVVVKFFIETDGSMSDFEIVKDIGYGSGQALVDVLKKAEKWEPGYYRNKKVRVPYVFPLPVNTRHFRELYKQEVAELENDFEIISFDDLEGYGRYTDDTDYKKIVLKNKLMMENVSMVFLAKKLENKIYSPDSIKKDYKEYVNRIQSITFITEFLKNNPSTKLDIYYFNNKGINEYNIKDVNKDSISWAKHDRWVQILKEPLETSKKKKIDLDKFIKTSQIVDCGCNYRFDKGYIEKAIFFEIVQDRNTDSIWFLLPDDKVLLYTVSGEKVLDFDSSQFGEDDLLVYACQLFDKNGRKITNP